MHLSCPEHLPTAIGSDPVGSRYGYWLDFAGKSMTIGGTVFGRVRKPVRRTRRREVQGQENLLRFFDFASTQAGCALSYESSALTN